MFFRKLSVRAKLYYLDSKARNAVTPDRTSSKSIPPNKALHRTAIPLRSIAAGELCRWADI